MPHEFTLGDTLGGRSNEMKGTRQVGQLKIQSSSLQ